MENEALQNEINTIRSSYINPSDLDLSSLPAATGLGHCPTTSQSSGYFGNDSVLFYNNNGDFESSNIGSSGKAIKVLKGGIFLFVLIGASNANVYGSPRLQVTNPEKIFTIHANSGSDNLKKSQAYILQVNAGCLIYPGNNNDNMYTGSLALRVYKLK